MTKFKIGDKVKIPITKSTGCSIEKSDIIEYALKNNLQYLKVVEIDNNGDDIWLDDKNEYQLSSGVFLESDLTLYEESPQQPTSKRIKITSRNGQDFGILGTDIGYKNLHVGDIIAYYRDNKIHLGVILENKQSNIFSIFGWFGRDVKSVDDEYGLKLVIPYTEVTPTLLDFVDESEGYFQFQESVAVNLTKSEIEKILGYEVNIID